MQIKINLKIFLFLIIFIITGQIKIYALLMLFAFIHELGHIAMGIILGFKPESISIIPTGFSVQFKAEIENCEFVGCTHVKEQNCGIKQAIENGKIDQSRYDRYCKIYEELKEKERYKW